MPADTPAGFYPLPLNSGFMRPNGPLYGKRERGQIAVALKVEPHHCNGQNICHGGMLVTVTDMLLAWGAVNAVAPRRMARTVSLSLDFISAAPLGTWIEGRAEVLRVTSTAVFVQAVMTSQRGAVLRASGTYKVSNEDDPVFDLNEWFPEIT